MERVALPDDEKRYGDDQEGPSYGFFPLSDTVKSQRRLDKKVSDFPYSMFIGKLDTGDGDVFLTYALDLDDSGWELVKTLFKVLLVQQCAVSLGGHVAPDPYEDTGNQLYSSAVWGKQGNMTPNCIGRLCEDDLDRMSQFLNQPYGRAIEQLLDHLHNMFPHKYPSDPTHESLHPNIKHFASEVSILVIKQLRKNILGYIDPLPGGHGSPDFYDFQWMSECWADEQYKRLTSILGDFMHIPKAFKGPVLNPVESLESQFGPDTSMVLYTGTCIGLQKEKQLNDWSGVTEAEEDEAAWLERLASPSNQPFVKDVTLLDGSSQQSTLTTVLCPRAFLQNFGASDSFIKDFPFLGSEYMGKGFTHYSLDINALKRLFFKNKHKLDVCNSHLTNTVEDPEQVLTPDDLLNGVMNLSVYQLKMFYQKNLVILAQSIGFDGHGIHHQIYSPKCAHLPNSVGAPAMTAIEAVLRTQSSIYSVINQQNKIPKLQEALDKVKIAFKTNYGWLRPITLQHNSLRLRGC